MLGLAPQDGASYAVGVWMGENWRNLIFPGEARCDGPRSTARWYVATEMPTMKRECEQVEINPAAMIAQRIAHPIISITTVAAPTSGYTFRRLHLFCVSAV